MHAHTVSPQSVILVGFCVIPQKFTDGTRNRRKSPSESLLMDTSKLSIDTDQKKTKKSLNPNKISAEF